MALSMTGYGRGEAILNGRDITVEIKSVNSRYFEYSSRIPRSCAFLDDKLKKLLSESISRGKVELSLQMQSVGSQDVAVEVDLPLAKSYADALAKLADQLGVKNDATAGLIARYPDVLSVRHADVDEEQLWQDVSTVCRTALENFVAMRATEGEKLKADVMSRLATIEANVGKVEEGSAERVKAYTQKLYTACRPFCRIRTSTRPASSPKLPSSAIKPPWMRKRCACAAISPSTERFWKATARWAASWTF